jgi:hypothetical protein
MVFCLMASFCVPHNERRLLKTTGQFRPPTYDGLRLPMTIRGGGVPAQTMAYVPRKRMGPPPRSFAADAHDCIMVRVLGPTEYKVVARLIRAPERGLPSDRHLDRTERAAVLGVTKAWLGPQSAWRSRATANLDSWPARAGFATKKPDPRSNKETDKESKKDPLDWRGQRPGRHFWRHWPIPGNRDRAAPPLRWQSRGKSKTIPNAVGNRNRAGLRGGAGRTRTADNGVMQAPACETVQIR